MIGEQDIDMMFIKDLIVLYAGVKKHRIKSHNPEHQ